MMMTILKGDLATKQRKALIRKLKIMKDYILDNRAIVGQCEGMSLSMQMAENTAEISKLRMDIDSVERYTGGRNTFSENVIKNMCFFGSFDIYFAG